MLGDVALLLTRSWYSLYESFITERSFEYATSLEINVTFEKPEISLSIMSLKFLSPM